jgi:hypothetical protein
VTAPDPVVLVGRRRYAGIWFGVAAFGAAFGMIMVAGSAWAGWFLIIVFLPSAIILGLALRPQANELRLDATGYAVTSAFRVRTTRWSDVERIGTIDGTREPLVAIRLAPAAAATEPDAAEIAAAMGGYHRTLPLTYGMDADELAALMRRYQSG